MTNNSPVYWTANGLSLHTHAWSVKSFGGRRFWGPSKRGEDLHLPFRPGFVHMPKGRNPQLYDISMWVLPLNPDGTKSPTLNLAQMAHKNWRTIVGYLDVDGQFPLVKRWYEDTTVKSATAQAEFLEGDGPKTDDGQDFYCDVTLTLADPYFYGPQVSKAIGTITVEGEANTARVILEIGPGRVTFPDGNWIEYNGTGTVTIDCLNGTAKKGTTYVNGQVERNRLFPEWPKLTPGSNAITGSGTIKYQPAYR